jgi:hypothetical protein
VSEVSFDTYANLQAEIIAWSDREDLAAKIPQFIMLTEKAMDIRKLKVKEQLVDVVGYVDSTTPTIAFPNAPFTEVWQAVPTGSWTGDISAPVVESYDGKPLERLSTLMLLNQNQANLGVPQYFCDTPTSTAWRFWPLAPYEITVTVYGKTIPLSDTNPINAILTNYPHLYLYGALAEIERYLKIPPAESQGWAREFVGALDAANLATQQSLYSGSTLRTKSPR